MNKQDLGILAAVTLALLAVALGLFAVSEAGQIQDIEALGVTNLSSLTLDDDLIVGNDALISGDATFSGVVNGISQSTLTTLTTTSHVIVGGDLDVDGATSLDAVTTGIAGTGNDVQFFSDTSGDHLLWDASEEALEITGTNAQTALLVDDGNVAITDDLDVDGTTNLDVTDIDGAVNMAEDLTLAAASGNQAAKTELVGIPKIQFVVGNAGSDGSTTLDVIDANPMGECAEVDAGTNVALTADTDIFRATTNSVKLAVTTPADNDGWDCTVAQTDLDAFGSLGFWIYSDELLSAGDVDVTLDDSDGSDQAHTFGQIEADTWTYVEIDISNCNVAGDCDTVDGIHFLLTAQGAGALSTPNIYVDLMYVWLAADEEALGVSVIPDGVLDVIVMVTATGSNRIPLPALEYTSWVTHYESGVDFIVYLDNQSGNSVLVLVATE